MTMKPPTIDDIYMADAYLATPGVRQGLLERASEGNDDEVMTEDTDDGQVVYYRTPYGEMVPVGRPIMLAAGPSQTMTDAPAGATIGPLPQTTVEKALEQTGLTLEQAGRFLHSLGQVQIPGTELRFSLADLVPFVGSEKEGSTDWQGTPRTLQKMGTGVGSMVDRVTTGTGMARQLDEDAKLTAMEVMPIGVSKAARSVGKALKVPK